jgi:hypothetical protein
MKTIKLNEVEIRSNFDRVSYAERLILQLSEDHEGRNTWLLNYGKSDFAMNLRKEKNLDFNNETQSCELTGESKKLEPCVFKNAVIPAMKYMAENHSPHSILIIQSDKAEIYDGSQVFTTDEFVVD